MNGDHARVFRPVPRTGVIFVMTEAARRGFRYGNPEWVNLGQGAPETGPMPGAPRRLDHITVDVASHEYAPVDGLLELKEAVAALYNARYRRGMPSQYTAENVSIAGGGRTGLTRVAAALGNVHLGHLLPDYTAYEELFDLFRAFVPIPIAVRADEGFRLSPQRLEEAILGMGLGAILLSNPCNPTGQVVDAELDDWLRIARARDCALVFDEFYAHYVYDAQGPVSAARYIEDVDRDPVVLIDGLTKNWRYPGWRLSWTLGPRDVIRRIGSAGSFLDGGAPHPLQRAALPLLDRDVADQEALAIRTTFRTKRDRMVERVRAMGMKLERAPGGAFYCFPSLAALPEPLRDGMAFFEAALEQQVICVPGGFFDIDPGKRRGHVPSRLAPYVRLSFGPELESVDLGLDRLAAMIRDRA